MKVCTASHSVHRHCKQADDYRHGCCVFFTVAAAAAAVLLLLESAALSGGDLSTVRGLHRWWTSTY
jgi:hypothetical protein